MDELEVYDECIYDQPTIAARLTAPRTLSDAGIPCLIHGEDALSFVYFASSALGALNIIVSDANLERAKAKIMDIHRYDIFTGFDYTFHESAWLDPDRTRAFPNSVFLERMDDEYQAPYPYLIIIHPETEFNLAVTDYSRSVPLPPFPDKIRFPTKVAFLDSAMEIRLDPNWGVVSSKITQKFAVWIVSVIECSLRTGPYVDENGNLREDAEALRRSLRPENRVHFEEIVRDQDAGMDRKRHMLLRREILRILGYVCDSLDLSILAPYVATHLARKADLADRPLPRLPPGNPNFLQDSKKKRKALGLEAPGAYMEGLSSHLIHSRPRSSGDK